MNNSEILFIYDAVLCNPNGDIDEENRPRMDHETGRNLVSDVRLKRYIRDYLLGKGYEIFVAELEGKTVNATQRIEEFCRKNGFLDKGESLANAFKDEGKRSKIKEKILEKMFDVRVFGAVIPVKAGEGEREGAQETFTGPVQFNWGYSLNPVTINPSASITSIFSGRERAQRAEQYGTIGKDWRVLYSLIAFHGIVSARRGKLTRLKDEDILILDNALLKAIPVEATTRSKIGQTPRLLLRVEYKDDETFLGDFRPLVKIRTDGELEKIRSVEDFKLEVTPLLKLFAENDDKISKFFVWQDTFLQLVEAKRLADLLEQRFGKDRVSLLPHNIEI